VDDGVNAFGPVHQPLDRLSNGVVVIYVHVENLEVSCRRQFRAELSRHSRRRTPRRREHGETTPR
jgi:hypothetical protein